MGDYPVTLDMVSGRVGSTITVPLLWSEGGVPRAGSGSALKFMYTLQPGGTQLHRCLIW